MSEPTETLESDRSAERLELFEEWARSYDEHFDTAEFPFVGYDAALEFVVQSFAKKPGARLLEFGTGTGNLTQRLLAAGHNVTGTDFSEAMLNSTRQKLPSVELLSLDLLRPDSWAGISGRFDGIVASYVLHEFPLMHTLRILDHFGTQHLGPTGCIVFADIGFPTATLRESAKPIIGNHWDDSEFYFAADEFEAAVHDIGFEVESRQISSCACGFTLYQGSHRV